MEFFFLISQMRSFSINQRNLFISGVMKRPCESFINQDFSVYLMSVVRLTMDTFPPWRYVTGAT